MSQISLSPEQQSQLCQQIKAWGSELGFADIGITNCDLSDYEADFFHWLERGYHGEMAYMTAHGSKRTRPAELEPGTLSLISVRMNYFDDSAENALQQLHQDGNAYVSRYALGKDYHKLLRKRLQQLADKIQQQIPKLQYRAFTDSAPVLEQAIAHKAGLGFIGKNSLIIHPRAGSWFFLGELYVNVRLIADTPFQKQGCGNCTACISECPTNAILPNNQVDARRCISYLTIEYNGVIPEELRHHFGNRIYGCDDCQLVCPWNHFAQTTKEDGFATQYAMDQIKLLELWQWSEDKFLKHFQGSPIRRIGFEKWQRNLAVAIGNIQQDELIHQSIQMLKKPHNCSELVQTHIDWALNALKKRALKKQTLNNAQNSQTQNLPVGEELTEKPLPTPFKVKKYYYPANRIGKQR